MSKQKPTWEQAVCFLKLKLPGERGLDLPSAFVLNIWTNFGAKLIDRFKEIMPHRND